MAQGISPNNLNKISQVYLSQISEHHKKDADGNTIPHEGEEVIPEAKYEAGASTYGKASIRNKRMFGKGGNAADPAERGAAIDARGKAHKEKRGVKTKVKSYHYPFELKTDVVKQFRKNKMKEEVVHEKKEMIKVKLKDPSKIKVKVTDIGPGGKEYVRKNEMDEETENEGMQYGIFKGDGKPKGPMAAFGKKKKEKKKVKMEGLSNWKED